MFIIGEAIIDDGIAGERFACDLAKCKGACCTLPGGRGAPLADAEVGEIRRAYPAALPYLPPRNLDVIAKHGAVEGIPGSYATLCIEDRDCVFVYYEGDVAKCALERAFNEGLTNWRKPLSCHLFPIRVRRDQADHLRYERISECNPARARGSAENVPLYDFLEDPLVRAYGRKWYDEFRQACLLVNKRTV